jgi:hypothetical protein
MPPIVKPLVAEPNAAVDAAPQSPKTDKGWQAYLSNVRAPAKRVQKPLGAGLAVLLEPSGLRRSSRGFVRGAKESSHDPGWGISRYFRGRRPAKTGGDEVRHS